MGLGATAGAAGSRLARHAAKTLVWAVSIPCALLPESPVKEAIRIRLLHFQNNVPWRLQVGRGETAIQVGTPNPRTVRRYSKRVGATGRVVVVEAEPGNAERLRRALAGMPHPNVTIVQKGAWSEQGRLRLVLSPHHGDNKIPVPGIAHDNDYRPENTYERSVEIEVDTLDNIVRSEGLDRVDYVSITVNGAEIEVLKGCEALLTRRPLRCFVKAHARQSDGRPINEAIMAMLRARGFTVHRTAGEPAAGTNPDWTVREGDVYAFKR